MRLHFHDLNFNLNSKSKSNDLPCECQSRGTSDHASPITLREVNENNRRFYSRDAATPAEMERKWNELEAASRDKLARALAKDSPTEGLRIMNDANRSFWAARGVR